MFRAAPQNKEVDMTKLNVLASEWVGAPDQVDDDFVDNSPPPPMRIYKGPYPMMDHIKMPVCEPSVDFYISTSVEFLD